MSVDIRLSSVRLLSQENANQKSLEFHPPFPTGAGDIFKNIQYGYHDILLSIFSLAGCFITKTQHVIGSQPAQNDSHITVYYHLRTLPIFVISWTELPDIAQRISCVVSNPYSIGCICFSPTHSCVVSNHCSIEYICYCANALWCCV